MANAAAEQDETKFRVDSRVEIAYILRSLAKSSALVTAYFNGDREFIVTAVLSVDTERGVVILDAGAKEDSNQRLLRSRDLSMVSTQDGIKVQFAADGAQAAMFEGKPALRIPFPHSLLKLQRREYYRMPTPVLNPIKCEVPAAGGKRVALPVADISLGGVCLVGEVDGAALEVGTVLEGSRIELPDAAVLTTDLCVRNSYVVTLKNGQGSRRSGCEFLRLGPQQEAALQRYIIRLERDRRAKTAGARG